MASCCVDLAVAWVNPHLTIPEDNITLNSVQHLKHLKSGRYTPGKVVVMKRVKQLLPPNLLMFEGNWLEPDSVFIWLGTEWKHLLYIYKKYIGFN